MSYSCGSPSNHLGNCPCQGGTLDKLVQPAILAILAQGPLHGYKLAERVGGMPLLAGSRPDMSGVYRSLKTMERNGLVVSCWDLSDTGPAKKSYRLTEAGRQCLVRWIQSLEHYRRGITALLRISRKAVAREGAPCGGPAETAGPRAAEES